MAAYAFVCVHAHVRLGGGVPSAFGGLRAHVIATATTPLASVQASVGQPAEFVAKLESLKAEGAAPKWDSIRLAPRLVPQAELNRVTQIDPELLLGGAQFDYKKLTLVTVGASSVLGLAVSFATFLRDDIRFALTYLIALAPIGLLGIGSIAPGLLELPANLLSGKGSQAAERAARHEAAHLLVGYCCGVPLEDFSIEKGREAVQFAGESAGPLDLQRAQALLVIAMSGMIGEYGKYGDSSGGRADLSQMQIILARIKPRLSPAEQQGYTRWAALMSWSYLQMMPEELEATTAAMQRGASLGEVLEAIETANPKAQP
jgi:hypothetical protein